MPRRYPPRAPCPRSTANRSSRSDSRPAPPAIRKRIRKSMVHRAGQQRAQRAHARRRDRPRPRRTRAHRCDRAAAAHVRASSFRSCCRCSGPFAVHGGRPFFPADVAAALAEVPAPRMLVTTPIHLQALLRDPLELPPLAAITSATAPLCAELAAEAEARYGAPVVELFGSTETCVIAHRRTVSETAWRLYPDIVLKPQPDGSTSGRRGGRISASRSCCRTSSSFCPITHSICAAATRISSRSRANALRSPISRGAC